MSFDEIKFYLSIFWRRFPYFLVVTVLVTAIGVSVAIMLPPVYRSQAALLVESQQIPDELAFQTVASQTSQRIDLIQQRLLSRNNLLEVSRKHNIFGEDSQMPASNVVAIMRASTTFTVLRQGNGIPNGILIGFSANEAEVTARVANEFAARVLEENVQIRTDQASETLRFFEQEVVRLAAELDRVSAQILDFKVSNEGALPESLEFRRSEQARIQERLLQLEREETDLLDTRARLVELTERTGGAGRPTVPLTPEAESLATLKDELRQQLVVLSETNPRVVVVKNRIAALEEIVKAQREAAGADLIEEYSALEVQLEEISGRLEYINSEQVRLDRELARVTETIAAAPEIESRLAGLERQLDTLQSEYDVAVSRRAAAATGERIELLSKGERFSIIEPAIPPLWAESPNRKLLAMASLVLGIGAGLGLVFLLELMNRSIRRPVEIQNKLGIQPFGTVPYVRTRREKITKRAIVLLTILALAVAVPSGIWAVHEYYKPIDLVIEEIIQTLGLEPFIGPLL